MKTSEKLSATLKASGWSQEQLAYNLGVSFVTLNSWVNERSVPRRTALIRIEKLYLEIVGLDIIDEEFLQRAKKVALALHTSVSSLTKSKDIRNILTLYLTYHTNTIEGSTMTLGDVEDVIFDNKVLSNRTAIEQAEARNHQAALHWLIEKIDAEGTSFIVDERLILDIHLRLMNGILSDAGRYRTHSVRITSSRVVLANHAKISEFVKALVEELQNNAKDTVSRMAEVHAKFEQIHPFSDGNGRTGRLIMLAQALQSDVVPPLVIKERKYAYYKYLEIAQTKEDYRPLELFIAESMQFTHQLLNSKKQTITEI